VRDIFEKITRFCYNIAMKSKSLLNSNRHLRNPKKMREALVRSIASSTAIETGEAIHKIEARLNRRCSSSTNRIKLA